jgi:hypothetical protein
MRASRFLVLMAVVGFTACSGTLKYPLQSSGKVVGSDAEVIANINKEQANTRLEIKTTNLPPPDRVEAGTDSWVVWQRRDKGTNWSRVGVLKYDPDARRGELIDVTVPETEFDLQITPESGPSPGAATNPAVFSQRVARD